MKKESSTLKDKQYKDALMKYAEAFSLKKGKTKDEKQLLTNKKRYVIYARKSTEDDKRQVQSIEDQIDHCRKYAKQNNLEVVAEIREEKSAKTAGRRPEFQEMINTLHSREFYNSILAWHPDRLSRNMKESGEILDMLDNDVIEDLKFVSYSFNNDPAGKMTLSILFAMAKEFSDKLSEDTKRGNKRAIMDGKHCGSNKRGYYMSRKGYYRKDKNNFDKYAQAWQQYKNGMSQIDISKILVAQGEEINKNSLSNFFRDPFYAGINCYGDMIVDMSVDPEFEPLVSPRDFLEVQKLYKGNPRGWKISKKFKPFYNFVICNDCGREMTPGISEGEIDFYLSVTCGNSKCSASRRKKGLKPVSNTIRGQVIMDFVIEFLKNSLSIDRNLYNKKKKEYFEESNHILMINNEQIKLLKSKVTKLEKKEKLITKRIIEEENKVTRGKLSNECNIVVNQIRALTEDIQKLELRNKNEQLENEMDFPIYDDFVNFFKKVIIYLENKDNLKDAFLIDQLVKLVFLNITVSDKKVVKYTLMEPFEAYNSLKITNGVEDGI